MEFPVILIGAHGAGDASFCFKCLPFIKKAGKVVNIFLAVRENIYEILYFFYGDLCPVAKISETWAENNAFIFNPLGQDLFAPHPYQEIYYVIPDLLFSGPLHFDYLKYGTAPQLIKQTRTLTHKYEPQKIIYAGLATSTDGYLYSNCVGLLRELAERFTDYTIYFPKVTKWADKNNIDYGDLSNLPTNVVISENPPITEWGNILKTASYFIGTCNGPSHFAYDIGIPRLILDPQFNKLPWIARWKECPDECIPIMTDAHIVAKIVEANIRLPFTGLVPRRTIQEIVVDQKVSWNQLFFLKYN